MIKERFCDFFSRTSSYWCGLSSESNRSPWLLELIAGMVEKAKSQKKLLCVSEEEAKRFKSKFNALFKCVQDSPGGIVERIHLLQASG